MDNCTVCDNKGWVQAASVFGEFGAMWHTGAIVPCFGCSGRQPIPIGLNKPGEMWV
jgi:hypothetical protein